VRGNDLRAADRLSDVFTAPAITPSIDHICHLAAGARKRREQIKDTVRHLSGNIEPFIFIIPLKFQIIVAQYLRLHKVWISF
jgi:hypothetical protein